MRIAIPSMWQASQIGENEYINATDYATRNGQDLIKGFIVSTHSSKIKDKFVGCEPQRQRFVTMDQNYYYGVRPVLMVGEKFFDEDWRDVIAENLIKYIDHCTKNGLPIELGSVPCDFRKDASEDEYQYFCENEHLLGNGIFMNMSKEELAEIDLDQNDSNSFYETVSMDTYRNNAKKEQSFFHRKPVRWIYNERGDFLMSEEILFGISIDRKLKELEKESDYESEWYSYYPLFYQDLLNQLEREVIVELRDMDILKFATDKGNVFSVAKACHLDTEEELSCKEQIENALKANIPVFLHGKPGEGKSARAREIDPDCTTLELALAPVEDLAGINVYFNHQLQKKKPEWLEELEKKCSDEPEKIHILFLDELTNAMPAIQQLAYSLILDHRVANEWDLPQNVRIIAAGNEVEDSSAASEIPEPLRDRFAHVNVHTSVAEWIEWATNHDIHPAIISYITYRGENALRSAKVEGEISTTPRTWERASKMLQATNDVRFLSPIIGEYQSADFIAFCQMVSLDKEDILNDMISTSVFQDKDIAMKMAMVRGLTNVSIEEFETVRNFVKSAGKESLALFENLWISQKKEEESERIDKVEELHMLDEEYGEDDSYEY